MTAAVTLDPRTGQKAYKSSPSPDHLLDNPDDPRFKVPAQIRRVQSVTANHSAKAGFESPNKRTFERIETELQPPYPNLQKPKDPSENLEYIKKVCANAAWERDREAAELLVDCVKRRRENEKFVAFQKTPAFKAVFGNKRLPD